MKVLVCGGRDYADYDKVSDVLDTLDEDTQGNVTTIIHGDSRGADSLAGEWARRAGAQEVKCPANWVIWDRAAGPIRNQAMLELGPDLVVAFPGGAGTRDMVRKARAASVDVLEIT